MLRRLFGGNKKPIELEKIDLGNGYQLVPTPKREGGGMRVSGRIERNVDGKVQSYEFVRADVYENLDYVVATTKRKAEQIIREQGNSIFK